MWQCYLRPQRLLGLRSGGKIISEENMTHNHNHAGMEVGAKLRFGVLFSMLIVGAGIAGCILPNSVALLPAAGHVRTDVIALALSLYAVSQPKRPATRHMTFGYHRIGVLTALLNASP